MSDQLAAVVALKTALAASDRAGAGDAAKALDWAVPHRLRASLWSLLLLGPRDEAARVLAGAEELLASFDADGGAALEQFGEARVVAQDVERTRADVPYFHSAGTQAWLRRSLVAYCVDSGVEYMQGLNEIMAPFLLIDADVAADDDGSAPLCGNASDSDVVYGLAPKPPSALHFCLFRAVVPALLPTMFSGDAASMRSAAPLRTHLRLFGDLALFHEPKVARGGARTHPPDDDGGLMVIALHSRTHTASAC